MRKYLLAALLILLTSTEWSAKQLTAQSISTQTTAQLNGFWGIPFGFGREQVRALMAQRGLQIEEESEHRIIFEAAEGINFAGHSVVFVSMNFFEGKFFGADIALEPTEKDEVLANYHSLKTMLAEKYGIPKVYEFSTHPQAEGKTNIAHAIKKGRCAYSSHWNISDPDGLKGITLQITKLLTLQLSYEHKTIAQAYKAYQRRRLMADL